MIDPEIKNYIDSQLAQQTHDGNSFNGQRINFFSIFGQVETVTTAPSAAPIGGSPYDQIKIHYNSVGPVWKLYIYDYLNSVWKSVTIA